MVLGLSAETEARLHEQSRILVAWRARFWRWFAVVTHPVLARCGLCVLRWSLVPACDQVEIMRLGGAVAR